MIATGFTVDVGAPLSLMSGDMARAATFERLLQDHQAEDIEAYMESDDEYVVSGYLHYHNTPSFVSTAAEKGFVIGEDYRLYPETASEGKYLQAQGVPFECEEFDEDEIEGAEDLPA